MILDRLKIGRFALLATLLVCAIWAGTAHASFTNFSFSSEFGSFLDAESIAVDEATGSVYVYNAGTNTIEKFDAAGNPVDFSALASNSIMEVGGRPFNESEIAVDNSSGPAHGDIYLATGASVQVYGSDGQKLGELVAAGGAPWGEPCGVAVDRNGNVYVGLYGSNVNEYAPVSNPVTSSDYVASLGELDRVCNIAADASGDVYVDTWEPSGGGEVTRYDASQLGASAARGTIVAAHGGGTLAASGSFDGEAFIDTGREVQQYDSSGNLLSTFGASGPGALGSASLGIAFDARNGKLYVSNPTSRAIEVWQGTPFLPAVQTSPATGLSTSGEATLAGLVEPEGSSIEECAFQYGTSETYGSLASCSQSTPFSSVETVPVSAPLSGVLLNNVYHYRLVVANEHGTVFGPDHTFAVLVAPTIEEQTVSASSFTRASAQLSAKIVPEQGETSYHYELGTTEAYGHSTPIAHTANGLTGETIASQLAGELLPSTTYHYRLVISNLGGRAVGADHTFTTAAPTPPLVLTTGAAGVAQNSATISATVDTQGLPTSYGFEIGTSTDYGPPTGLGTIGAGLSETPVSLALSGLLPGTTYHYRITATNVDGTSYGADQTFTTGVFASTFATPPAPLPFVAVPTVSFPMEGAVAKQTKVKQKAASRKRRKTRHASKGKSRHRRKRKR
jgi:hypothetical protein